MRVRLFASFREAVGSSVVDLGPMEGRKVSELLAVLAECYPALAGLISQAMVAVNLEYVGPEHRLRDGDEVALIPPVSGGADGALQDRQRAD